MTNGFKNRLKRLHGARKRASERSETDENRIFVADDVDERTNQAAERVANPLEGVEERWEKLGATPISNEFGNAAVIQRNHAQSMQHGQVRLVEAAACSLNSVLAALDVPAPPNPSVQNAVFLDLETTGLRKTDYAFCIGIGLWEQSRFVVRHYVMRRDEEERAALKAFQDDLPNDGLLISYNGRSFDVPMLTRRLEHHNIEHSLDEMAHLDLLDAARKAWPKRDTHKLSAAEADICGLQRHDDVAGARIPQLWKTYLEDGEPGRLFGIFKHNRLDIVSLLALLPELVGALGGSQTPTRQTRSSRSSTRRKSNSKKPKQSLKKNHEVSSKNDTPLKQSLSRNYQLRSRAKGEQGRAARDIDGREKGSEKKRVQLGGSLSRSKLREKMPVGQHIRDLRKRAEKAEDSDERTALLHEILAISPRHVFALRELAATYRAAGKDKLAEVLERRLEDEAPY
ncbi:MAG: ribonuclease H-like domain-containing protein [Myxococcota bacterium]